MEKSNRHVSWQYVALTVMALYIQQSHAQSMSFQEAEAQLLEKSFANKAAQNLEQAAKLQAEAVKGLGLPEINVNVQALAYRTHFDVPLDSVKKDLTHGLVDNLDQKIDQWQNNSSFQLPQSEVDLIKQLGSQGIHDGIGLIPNSYELSMNDQMVRPSLSMLMPLYTGGIIKTTKDLAKLNQQRSELGTQQQYNLQQVELIQVYFNVQLQKQITASAQYNLQAMQTHYRNALKLEQQGFISKGQRLQFEVARNNAERLAQNSQVGLQTSLFKLNNLLQNSQITQLTTPLFVNTTQTLALNDLLKTYTQQSTLLKKLETDTHLAEKNIKIQEAAKKPTLFAFGEYSLESQNNWIVGVAAQYNLFSGIDKNKNIRAAEHEHQAAQLLSSQTKQEIETLIYTSYNELMTAQQSDTLIQANFKAARENLRIQELSFKEDMGTATQVIDAQNMLHLLQTESALNAYKYVLSLAALLQSHGTIQQFQSFIHQPNTHYIQ